MKEKFKFWFINLLEKITPNSGCWCNRSMWALGYKNYSFIGLFKGAKGCKEEAKTHELKCCYCGKYNNNPEPTPEELKEAQEALQNLIRSL